MIKALNCTDDSEGLIYAKIKEIRFAISQSMSVLAVYKQSGLTLEGLGIAVSRLALVRLLTDSKIMV